MSLEGVGITGGIDVVGAEVRYEILDEGVEVSRGGFFCKSVLVSSHVS